MVRTRQTAIVIASVLLLVSSGVVVAATFSAQEGFEDGTIGSFSGGTVADQGINGSKSLNLSADRGNTVSYRWTEADGQWNLNDSTFRARVKTNQGLGYNVGPQFELIQDSENYIRVYLQPYENVNGNGDLIVSSGDGGVDEGVEDATEIDLGTWYNVEVTATDLTVEVRVWEVGTTKPQTPHYTRTFNSDQTGDVYAQGVFQSSGADNIGTAKMYLDGVALNEPLPGAVTYYNVSGRVSDEGTNDYISGASVEVYDGQTLAGSDTTNSIGQYDVGGLENGTYTMWVNKTGYQNENRTITVDGSDQTQNFALASFNGSINLRVRNMMDHGGSYPYSVIVTIDGDRKVVTDTATVTSSNTSVVTVDTQANELVATSNIAINDRVTITAEYTDSQGNTYTTERNVTVANATVENMQILPTAGRFEASLDDTTIQTILVAVGLGAGVALLSSSFGGLGATTLVMTIGWLAGRVGDGMVIVTVLIALFIGLNMAMNINYTVMNSQ